MTEINWEKEKFDKLIAAAMQAINRSRYVFIVLNISGIVIVGGLFNATFPWLRNTIDRVERLNANSKALKHYIKISFEDLSIINMPLIGMKIHVYDLNMVAATALLIIVIWQYYCVRRENNVIRVILQEIDKTQYRQNYAAYIYHSIVHYFVFTTRFLENNADNKSSRIAKAIIGCLLFMPSWIPVLIFISDASSVFIPQLLQQFRGEPIASTLSPSEWAELTTRWLYALSLSLVSFIFCIQCRRYDMETRNLMEKIESLNASNV